MWLWPEIEVKAVVETGVHVAVAVERGKDGGRDRSACGCGRRER